MDQQLAVILATDPDEQIALARHDRCAAWAATQGWRLRKRLIFDGESAQDHALIQEQIKRLAEGMAVDILVTESLSQLGTSPLELVSILDLLDARGIRLVALKECLDGPSHKTALTAILGAVSPNEPGLKLVYAGPKEDRQAAQRVADCLGWDLTFSRASRIDRQLQSTPDRALLLPSLMILGELMSARAGALDDLLRGDRRIFVLDAGVDSSAPNARVCMHAHIAAHAQPDRNISQPPGLRPEPLELLRQWIGRRRKIIPGSAVKYIAQSGYSSSAFYRVVHGTTLDLINELKALAAANGHADYTARDLELIARKHALSIDDLQFAIAWSKKASTRSHSSTT